jgi:hypothetical protein
VKQVTGNHNRIGSLLDDPADNQTERIGNIRFTLVDPEGVLTVVGSKAQMHVGQMREFHGA